MRVNAHISSADHADVSPPAAPALMRWARLLKRVFKIDMEHCSQCGGPLKIIAAIEHPSVIAKILRAFADRLKAAGKPAQVVIVTCMRKLLSIMNAMLKSNLPWNPKIA